MRIHEAIAARIQNLCEKNMFSVNELARRSELTQSTVQCLLNGKSKNPSIETLYQIAELGFCIPLCEFFKFPDIKKEFEVRHSGKR